MAGGVEWPVSSRGRWRRVACGVLWPVDASDRRRRVACGVEWPAASIGLRRRVADCCLVACVGEWPFNASCR